MNSITPSNQRSRKGIPLQDSNLQSGVISFTITKTNQTERYCTSAQRIPNYITTSTEWEFEATVTYDLWLKLKPYTESRTVILKSVNIEQYNSYGSNNVTFTLRGSGIKSPCPLQLNQGFIPIGDNIKLLTQELSMF